MMIKDNLDQMCTLKYGMDILIISVTSPHEEQFWLNRLDQMRGQVIKEHAIVLTVYENWPGGAGNALGTLYAFHQATKKMQEKYGQDLPAKLEQGASVALYHTAGKGTRLAPITGSEYNSKSKIKLAGVLKTKKGDVPITLLEAIIKQTSIFAPHRKHRLSVFWGDQIFIPSQPLLPTNSDVDLLVKALPENPTCEEWSQNKYHQYGLVLTGKNQNFKQLEKLSYESFQALDLKPKQEIALSLGSFSLSSRFLKALLKEFDSELRAQKGKLDTDPHLWMALNWEKETYLKLRAKQNEPELFSESHYERMQTFKKSFSSAPTLTTSQLGSDTYWWDFGNHQSYLNNHLKLIQDSPESKALRTFLDVKPLNFVSDKDLKVQNSLLIGCHIQSGTIKNSVCINTLAHHAQLDESVCIDVSAQKIDTKRSILYNVAEKKALSLKSQIRADHFCKSHGHFKLYNFFHTPVAWDQKAKENPLSFASLHQLNQRLHPSEGQQAAQAAHHQIKKAVFFPNNP